MFIFAPGRDESLQPAAISISKQSAARAELSDCFKVDLGMGFFLSILDVKTTCARQGIIPNPKQFHPPVVLV